MEDYIERFNSARSQPLFEYGGIIRHVKVARKVIRKTCRRSRARQSR